jgi:3-oxoacyl-[acyl-carrier protein] reductase
MLQGKTALITGAGTGIGRSIALRLAVAGADIAIDYSRSEKEALQTQKAVEESRVQSLVYKADVADDGQVRAMVRETIQKLGRLDILVNNAGVTYFVEHADLEGLKAQYWDRIMDVNVKGMFM